MTRISISDTEQAGPQGRGDGDEMGEQTSCSADLICAGNSRAEEQRQRRQNFGAGQATCVSSLGGPSNLSLVTKREVCRNERQTGKS